MKKIMISAGEASGDLNGACLARAIKELCPSVELKGIGGSRMKSAGVQILFDISELAAVGFSEVAKNFLKIRGVFLGFCRKLDEENPDVLVLIDYPGFNMRLAERAKKRKIKVIYYISPQVWAWGRNRVYKIAENVNRMLVIFPFEKDFYEEFGIQADYVGHPIADRFGEEDGRPPQAFPGDKPLVCLLPGSRRQEVSKHLPVMLESACLIKKTLPNAEFIIGRAGTIGKDFINRIMEKSPLHAEVRENGECEAVRMSDFVIASSGTATVESAYFQKPMVVMYLLSPVTWIFARFLVKVKNIAMVNVIAGKRLVPEFVQSEAVPRAVSGRVVSILSDRKLYDRMVMELGEVKKRLGAPGAAERAARLVLQTAGAETDE